MQLSKHNILNICLIIKNSLFGYSFGFGFSSEKTQNPKYCKTIEYYFGFCSDLPFMEWIGSDFRVLLLLERASTPFLFEFLVNTPLPDEGGLSVYSPRDSLG